MILLVVWYRFEHRGPRTVVYDSNFKPKKTVKYQPNWEKYEV